MTLRYNTPSRWAQNIVDNFDRFLLDHAAAEKKASGMAMSMVSHYPDKAELVDTMTDLAIEELSHFREVLKLIHARGLQLGPDTRDQYVIDFRKSIRKGSELYLMDRLLIGGIIEARGAERFGLVAGALPAGKLKNFYQAITRSERRHFDTFVNLAYLYLERDAVDARLDELLDIEASLAQALPFTPALH